MTMTIGSTPAPNANVLTDKPSKTQVDYQSFLRLLVAEMKNQDPTNPMDSTQYVAQLASFSQVEQSVQINTKLDQLLQASSLSQAGALIGRTVASADGTLSGKVAEVRIMSDGIVAVLDNGESVVMGPGVVIKPGEA
ncbi:flagellar hook assembly protein FlgD [Pseudaminobacter sp. NGMCC 1.201702]|uniref:flagellar hook assembly protein FlgD n=1 Tax=Pseudaminobacter sp. NGMCC 1.201702 TaxID=3391825 RepID=UPI0039F025BE